MSEERFQPRGHLMNLKGKDYLPVAARVVWFRDLYPADSGWSIDTHLVDGGYEKKFAVYRCQISDPEGRVIAVGHNVEEVKGFGDFMQKAETGAIGRALATLGFGTMAALDEGTDNVVDSPVERPRLQPGDPVVEDYRCAQCGCDVPWEVVGPSRRRFNGKVYCVEHGKQLVEGMKAQGAAGCRDCGQIITEKVASASLQSLGFLRCTDCQRAAKAKEKASAAV